MTTEHFGHVIIEIVTASLIFIDVKVITLLTMGGRDVTFLWPVAILNVVYDVY